MTKKERYFNIHDIIKFKIITKDIFGGKFKNLYGQYKNFEVEKRDDLDFIVYLGDFTPNNQNSTILEGKYYVKDDYFYCARDSYKFTNWKFELSGFDNGNTAVRISSNFSGYLWMAGFIIDFLIHYKMNKKGFPIVHASCVSQDNKGFLFSARGGGGKTTIAINLLDKGFKILGDNFVILHKGNVLSYFSPLNIFTYNLAPIMKKNFGIKRRVILILKELVYKATGQYIKIFTIVNPKEIFPNLMLNNTELNTIFLLLPKDDILIEEIDKETLIKRLVINQKLDTSFFLEYISEYSYMFPDSELATHWKRYEENLNRNLSNNIKIYKMQVPQKYDENVFERILEVISDKSISNELV